MYLSRPWIYINPCVFVIEPEDKIFDWIVLLSRLLAGKTTLFIVDDMITEESIDKRRQSLLELAISSKHHDHYLWFLTQSHTVILKNEKSRGRCYWVGI